MPKHQKVALPTGHTWKEVDLGAAVVAFECQSCGEVFVHDLMDGSHNGADIDPCDNSEED